MFGYACLAVTGTLLVVLAVPAVFPGLFPKDTPQKDPDTLVTDADFSPALPSADQNTRIFSKYVSSDLPYILVDLNSGDPDDPLSLSIITPDRVLGPYSDGSDGIKDGRIFLRISKDDGMAPGRWKFVVHSNKTIALGGTRDYAAGNATGSADRPQT